MFALPNRVSVSCSTASITVENHPKLFWTYDLLQRALPWFLREIIPRSRSCELSFQIGRTQLETDQVHVEALFKRCMQRQTAYKEQTVDLVASYSDTLVETAPGRLSNKFLVVTTAPTIDNI